MIEYNFIDLIDPTNGKPIKQLVIVTADGVTSWIPTDLANIDYQAYLKSLEETA